MFRLRSGDIKLGRAITRVIERALRTSDRSKCFCESDFDQY